MPRFRSLLALFVALPLAAQQPESAAYVVRLGQDTIALERFTRSKGGLDGELLTRSPITRIAKYKAVLGSDGTMTGLSWSVARPDGMPAPNVARSGAITPRGDSADVELILADGTPRKIVVAWPKGSSPVLANSYAMWEAAFRSTGNHGDSITLRSYTPGAARITEWPVRFRGADSAEFNYGGDWQGFRFAKDGQLIRFDGASSTNKAKAVRVKMVDIAALGTAFQSRDAQGQALGPASPRDTARATVAGKALWIDYGRPHMRGRPVWGSLVPWGTVWRLGANAATQLKTETPLIIGGTTIPAGMYTLWMLPTATGAQLIVNKQTGQWGTAYDEKQDLVRLPLTRAALSSTAEIFTIAIDASGNGARLRFQWDMAEYVLAVTAP
ncbi:MAG: DUF2911 domain-containing protein [Gemmatimonadaceae bacterium]|nr:DUF2911 domain-containing protein [Gemmatimonadaceae bacterium]